MRKQNFCRMCGVDMGSRTLLAQYCIPCGPKRANELARLRKKVPGQAAAGAAVNRAVKQGLIPPARAQKCVDCGVQAAHYDHRDYNKPLDVVPVCRSCNARRGPAIPLMEAA